jgi:hypothetical protein
MPTADHDFITTTNKPHFHQHLGHQKHRNLRRRSTAGITYLTDQVPSLKLRDRHLITFLKLQVDYPSETSQYPELSLMASGGKRKKKTNRARRKNSRRKSNRRSSSSATSYNGDKYTHLPVVVLNALP